MVKVIVITLMIVSEIDMKRKLLFYPKKEEIVNEFKSGSKTETIMIHEYTFDNHGNELESKKYAKLMGVQTMI